MEKRFNATCYITVPVGSQAGMVCGLWPLPLSPRYFSLKGLIDPFLRECGTGAVVDIEITIREREKDAGNGVPAELLYLPKLLEEQLKAHLAEGLAAAAANGARAADVRPRIEGAGFAWEGEWEELWTRCVQAAMEG